MALPLSTERLAGASARHPWRVLAGWLAIVIVAGGLAATGLADSLTSDLIIERDVESIAGFHRLEDSGLTDVAPLTETIVVWSTDGLTVDDARFEERVTAVTDQVRALQARWAGEDGQPVNLATAALTGIGDYPPLYSWYELSRLGVPQAGSLVANNRQSTVIVVGLPSDGESGVRMHELYTTIDALAGDGIEIATLGQLTFQERFSEIAEEDLVQGESIGIPMALVILVAVFGALLAPVLPLILGVSSIVVALGAVTVLGRFGDQQLFIQNMITMLGLAVGIDYALFIVERFREERRAGYPKDAAIARAGATSGKAVVFSGATVVLSLAGVMLVPTNIFRSLGLGAILVVTVSVLTSLTLLPAMLGLLGDRINWPRRGAMAEPARERRQDPYSGFWGGITHVVMARPIVSVTLAAGLLLAAAIPAFDIHTGVESLTSLPPGQARDGYLVLVENYPAGITSPVQFVIGGPSAAAKPVVDNLREAILETGHFASELSDPTWSENGETAVFSAILLVEPDSDTAFEAIRNLRATIIPDVLTDSGEDNVEVWVTGAVPANVDFTDVISDYTPWVFAFVLTSSFVLLTLAFRSLIVPLKAIILNLLSVGATWGIMVLVFQKGFLADFLGFQQAPVIQIWVPILLFAVLFGLSMDYHVFLLSRIREQFDHSGNNRESVAIGLHSTARIITGAALIMVVVFGGFATGSLVALQQLGFGLAVAVFLDATIVRTVLVPSTMALLGDRNWYLPGWLQWLPDFRIEGQLDAPESFPARGDGE